MTVFRFNQIEKNEVNKVIDYANLNIYSMDNLLDIKIGSISAPWEKPEHLVRIQSGCWICYYLIDHPNLDRCHCFLMKPDVSGHLPDKNDMEKILRGFGVKEQLDDSQVTTNKGNFPHMAQIEELLEELQIGKAFRDSPDRIDREFAQISIVLPILN